MAFLKSEGNSWWKLGGRGDCKVRCCAADGLAGHENALVVPFTGGDERGDKMVSGSVLVIERSVSEVVGQRINAERRLQNEGKGSVRLDWG